MSGAILGLSELGRRVIAERVHRLAVRARENYAQGHGAAGDRCCAELDGMASMARWSLDETDATHVAVHACHLAAYTAWRAYRDREMARLRAAQDGATA